jgi:hypothetical protein
MADGMSYFGLAGLVIGVIVALAALRFVPPPPVDPDQRIYGDPRIYGTSVLLGVGAILGLGIGEIFGVFWRHGFHFP